jgi:hypothetical protein
MALNIMESLEGGSTKHFDAYKLSLQAVKLNNFRGIKSVVTIEKRPPFIY